MGSEDRAADYWVGKKLEAVSSCPNVSLFRFIGELGLQIQSQRVLEIGFGGNHGADLLEAKKRGADVYGTDINSEFLKNVNSIDPRNLSVSRAGVDALPFEVDFKLIYSRDVIYYLSDNELEFFFNDCYQALQPNGALIVQFIECDIEIETPDKEQRFDEGFFSSFKRIKIFSEDNPIHFLSSEKVIRDGEKAGFSFAGSKRLIQSYGTDESKFRVDRYAAFTKP